MNTFVEFPLVMNHPHYQPATHVTEQRDPNMPGAYKPTTIGTPSKLPPVTVYNAEQEAEHAAKGYVRAGVGDPAAYHALVSGAPPPDRQFHSYPKWKYHITKEAVIVQTPAQEQALGEGWQDRPGGFADPPITIVTVPTNSYGELIGNETPIAKPEPARATAKPKKKAKRKMSKATRDKIRATMKAKYAAQSQGA